MNTGKVAPGKAETGRETQTHLMGRSALITPSPQSGFSPSWHTSRFTKSICLFTSLCSPTPDCRFPDMTNTLPQWWREEVNSFKAHKL